MKKNIDEKELNKASGAIEEPDKIESIQEIIKRTEKEYLKHRTHGSLSLEELQKIVGGARGPGDIIRANRLLNNIKAEFQGYDFSACEQSLLNNIVVMCEVTNDDNEIIQLLRDLIQKLIDVNLVIDHGYEITRKRFK